MTRVFLTIVGTVYVLLAAWCSLMPEKTSKAVGYALDRGAGQSEFLAVYGGLELALGLIFLWPLFRPAEVAFPLLACLVVHGCLALFRTAGIALSSGCPATTYYFAATEWGIFLFAGVLYARGT